MKKNEITKMNKKIKNLKLDLRLKIAEIDYLDKWTKAKDKDYKFYLKIASLLEQAQEILCFGYDERGLLSLLVDKEELNE